MQPHCFFEIKAKNSRAVNITLKGLFDNSVQQRSQECWCTLSFFDENLSYLEDTSHK